MNFGDGGSIALGLLVPALREVELEIWSGANERAREECIGDSDVTAFAAGWEYTCGMKQEAARTTVVNQTVVVAHGLRFMMGAVLCLSS